VGSGSDGVELPVFSRGLVGASAVIPLPVPEEVSTRLLPGVVLGGLAMSFFFIH
jgi:hypothetical protein